MATMTNEKPFILQKANTDAPGKEAGVFRYGKRAHIICVTEEAGKPKNLDALRNEIRLGLGNVIPMWASGVTLYWRFNARSVRAFADPEGVKNRVRTLLGRAIDQWAEACPVRFAERQQGWDFEIAIRNAPDCDASGCVLASSFFPDSGQHKFYIYPTMFEQTEQEQVETMVHELGHVFGLRHFFANVSETDLASVLFGADVKFTIMNYGDESILTPQDRLDVKKVYEMARTGQLTAINGTQIKLMRPFSSIGFKAPA